MLLLPQPHIYIIHIYVSSTESVMLDPHFSTVAQKGWAVMAEWLRRWTWNPMGFPRAGSNPAHSDVKELFICPALKCMLLNSLKGCTLVVVAQRGTASVFLLDSVSWSVLGHDTGPPNWSWCAGRHLAWQHMNVWMNYCKSLWTKAPDKCPKM